MPDSPLGPHSHSPSLRWVHIPKAGQSFIITIVRYGCATQSRGNESLANSVHDFLFQANLSRRLQHARSMLNGQCQLLRQPLRVGHAGLDESEVGSAVALFRLPRQRLLSHCASMRSETRGAFIDCINRTVSGHLGVAAYQLAGRNVGNTAAPWNQQPTRVHVHSALSRLASGFQFVGLQEEWNASVRAFHEVLMPSVPVLPVELSNIHYTVVGDRRILGGPSWQQQHGCAQRDRCAHTTCTPRPFTHPHLPWDECKGGRCARTHAAAHAQYGLRPCPHPLYEQMARLSLTSCHLGCASASPMIPTRLCTPWRAAPSARPWSVTCSRDRNGHNPAPARARSYSWSICRRRTPAARSIVML